MSPKTGSPSGSVCHAAATTDSEEVDLQPFVNCYRTPSHSLAFDFITNYEADQQVMVSLKVP